MGFIKPDHCIFQVNLQANQANQDVNTNNNRFQFQMAIRLKYKIHIQEE